MNHYRQSIIVFGFVLPLLVAALAAGSVGYLRNKITSSFDNKSTHYKSYQGNRREALAIETRIGKERPHVSNWTRILRTETASEVTSTLRDIGNRLPAKEFQQTSFSRPSNSAGFGGVSAQQSAPLQLSFRATFRSMQQAFLELESRLPQLQLHELDMTKPPQSNNLLNFQVTYTAWEE